MVEKKDIISKAKKLAVLTGKGTKQLNEAEIQGIMYPK